MLTCPSVVARPQSCSAARVTGREGHQIAAIVLHPIQGPMESFESAMSTPLPQFCSGNINPLSTHFIVTELAAIQLVELSEATYGLDYFKKPTWPFLENLLPLHNPNLPFIHIAIKADAQPIALLNVICCIIQELGVALPIIASHDLQCDREPYLLDPNFITNVENCVASGGNIIPPPSWFDLWKRVQELEACCFSNSAQIRKLAERVTRNEYTIERHTQEITWLKEKIVILEAAVAIIPGLVETIRLIQEQIQNIIENCCPESTEDPVCFNYQLLAGQEQVITPNQPVHLNPPTKVIDQEPPLVITGPLWRAKLLGCTWVLEGIVRFRLNQWCAGSKAKLWLVACGVRTLLKEEPITSTGTTLVQLSFKDILQPACDNVYLEVETTDQTAQIVTFAEFKGCCSG